MNSDRPRYARAGDTLYLDVPGNDAAATALHKPAGGHVIAATRAYSVPTRVYDPRHDGHAAAPLESTEGAK